MGWVPARDTPKTAVLFDDTDPTGAIRRRMSFEHYSLVSLHIEHGGLTGDLTLYASNKEDPDTDSDDDWIGTDISITSPAGSSGTELINEADLAYRWLMLKYEHETGTGDLLVIATAKAG